MKRGSALLIVLGMMAFITVSALAFSAYMRAARLPSSYLRRTSSARQLVKAGLARAINEIDLAIGNDPHPGVGGNARNVWRHRVFFSGSDTTSPDSTVSPLCLEALAYMPPPLVNEARYFSRISPTAQWKSLGFDVGRYAYCALDVSDYFDVNRSMADVHRASSPQGRVSLAYLFESDGHTGPGTGASSWDEFLNQYRNFDEDSGTVDFKGQNPFISLADFNLALGHKGGVGVLKSPWFEYLSGGSGSGFYRVSGDADEERIRRMTFVTDGLFPASSAVDPEDVDPSQGGARIDRYDLNSGDNQPFAEDFLLQERPALSDVIMGTRLHDNPRLRWLEHLSGLGCAALYDYLDPDHVPISLAVPTTERAPMICGFETVMPGAKFAVRKTTDPANPASPTVVAQNGPSREVEVKVVYSIDAGSFVAGFPGGEIRTLVAFPFAHPDEGDGSSFNVDGRFSLFFTSEPMKLRTGVNNDVLHLPTPVIPSSAFDPAKSLFNVRLLSQQVGFSARPENEEDAVKTLKLGLREGTQLAPQLAAADNAILTVTYHWTQTQASEGGVGIEKWIPEFENMISAPDANSHISAAHCGIPALKASGTIDTDGFSDAKLLDTLKGGGGPSMTLNAALWLRVLDQQGKVVDLVPACWLDDKNQNLVIDPAFQSGAGGNYAGRLTGLQYPVMRLDTDISFKLSTDPTDGLEQFVSQPKDLKITPETAYVPDPRFNYAPEHWYAVENGNLSASDWLQQNANDFFSNGDHDGDIFMATSDAGYMQSPFEVAHLPRMTDLTGAAGDNWEKMAGTSFNDLGTPDRDRILGSGNVKNRNLMWRTFDPFDQDAYAFNLVPWTSEGSSFKINPYSDSTNVMMAVFANTPVDWKRASTNAADGAVDYWSMDAASFNRRYAMNEYTSDTQLGWRDLERVAGAYMESVRRLDGTWKDAWADLDWRYDRNNPDRFVGGELEDSDTLWTHDRKFLYGFWRDCFAVKQQLFLVFVRAEPMMMGSGAVGQIPPQLGARAVALVWRDPKATTSPDLPHRTRVLFYRQFE